MLGSLDEKKPKTRRIMSNQPIDANELTDPDRREILRAAGGAAIGGIAATALTGNTSALAQNAAHPSPVSVAENRDNAALGARLQGVQHFGVTVQNMDRAFEFYTEVLG